MKPMSKDENFDWLNKSDMDNGRLCLSLSRDILYHFIDIESPHEIWNKLKGLYSDEHDIEEHHLETKSSIYHSNH